LIGVVKKQGGWRNTFLMLAIVTALSGVPASFYVVKEYKDWK